MRGGHRHGGFYLGEVKRVEESYALRFPKFEYTPQQVQAGYAKLDQSFGFARTLRYLESQTPYKRDELVRWSVAEFKYELLQIAWDNFTERKYDEIMKKK